MDLWALRWLLTWRNSSDTTHSVTITRMRAGTPSATMQGDRRVGWSNVYSRVWTRPSHAAWFYSQATAKIWMAEGSWFDCNANLLIQMRKFKLQTESVCLHVAPPAFPTFFQLWPRIFEWITLKPTRIFCGLATFAGNSSTLLSNMMFLILIRTFLFSLSLFCFTHLSRSHMKRNSSSPDRFNAAARKSLK